VIQDDRAPFMRALRRAREAAYAPEAYIGQESFMRAGEIRDLAVQAGIGPGVSVLDLCCGVAGPGRFITRELGCAYLGVDASAGAIAIARDLTGGLDCRFEVGTIPPLPDGRYDVVLLLETILAFRDKRTLIDAIAGALGRGGRFAGTLEEGLPLTDEERSRMPDADTVWLMPREQLRELLADAGLEVRVEEDHSASHRATADALLAAFAADGPAIAGVIGQPALDDLLASHRLWSDWLASGRVRKLAFVAEKA
jgi:SAM-dependent methyltransferase